MKATILNPLRSHRFNVDQRFISIHTTERLIHGQKVSFQEQEFRIKEVIKDQPSRYYPKHNYYEIRI